MGETKYISRFEKLELRCGRTVEIVAVYLPASVLEKTRGKSPLSFQTGFDFIAGNKYKTRLEMLMKLMQLDRYEFINNVMQFGIGFEFVNGVTLKKWSVVFKEVFHGFVIPEEIWKLKEKEEAALRQQKVMNAPPYRKAHQAVVYAQQQVLVDEGVEVFSSVVPTTVAVFVKPQEVKDKPLKIKLEVQSETAVKVNEVVVLKTPGEASTLLEGDTKGGIIWDVAITNTYGEKMDFLFKKMKGKGYKRLKRYMRDHSEDREFEYLFKCVHCKFLPDVDMEKMRVKMKGFEWPQFLIAKSNILDRMWDRDDTPLFYWNNERAMFMQDLVVYLEDFPDIPAEEFLTYILCETYDCGGECILSDYGPLIIPRRGKMQPTEN